MREPESPPDDTPENTDGLPRIPNDDILGFMSAPEEERNRRTEGALAHMQRHNKVLHYVLQQISQRIEGVTDPVFFRTVAVAVYMFFLENLREKMPIVPRREYMKFERRAVRPDSGVFFQEIAEMVFTENYDLNEFLIGSFNQRGFLGSVEEKSRHMNGAMAVYYLLRKTYLKSRRRRYSN